MRLLYDQRRLVLSRPVRVLLRASFTAPDNTRLQDYTPEIGGPIVEQHTPWKILSGEALIDNTVAGRYQWTTNVKTANGRFKCRLKVPASSVSFEGGLCVRFTSPSDRYSVLLTHFGATVRLLLYEWVGGAATARGVDTTLNVYNQWVTVEVELKGDTIRIYVNGVLRITFSGSTHNVTATHVGGDDYRDATYPAVLKDDAEFIG